MKIRLFLITLLMTAPAFAGHHFHASATALTVEGANATMEQGAVHLRASGGESASSMEHYEDADVRFESAVSEVSGVEKDGVAYTVSTVTVRDLNVRNILRADEIILRISGRHHKDEAEAEISFEGSEYRNLTINGRPLEVELSFDRYAALPTFERIKRASASSRWPCCASISRIASATADSRGAPAPS